MGLNSSSIKSSQSSSSEENECNDVNFSIPYDLLVDVLSFVSTEDLIKHCRLVCKLWKDIIDGHSVWKIKCERENKFVPALKLKKLPLDYYRLIYIHNPYGNNLLLNSCGERRLLHWNIVSNSGDGFAIEDPPKGCDPVPNEVGATGCFATSYSPCQKYQIIDLIENGIHPDVLDLPTTKIEIGEWYSARFDCASVYKLEVILLNDKFNSRTGTLNFDECKVKDFQFQHREEQWTGKEWRKVSHTFDDISSTRYVFFGHFGRDSQFWAGHYGSKMTGAYVRVIA